MARVNKIATNYILDFETLTFDSEDYKRLGHTDVFLWYGKSMNGITKVKGRTLDEFFKWMKDGNAKNIKFHNLSFDGNFIIKYLMKTKLKFMNTLDMQELDTDGIKIPKNSWKIFSNGNTLYSIKIHFANNKTDWNIEITCSLKILSASVKALGKDFGMDKQTWSGDSPEEFYNSGGFNMTPTREAEMWEYIESDVEIVRKSMLGFMDSIKALPWSVSEWYNKKTKLWEPRPLNVFKQLTVGGIVMKLANNYIKAKIKEKDSKYEWKLIKQGIKLTAEEYRFAKNWMIGGFTQFNPKWQAEIDSSGQDFIKVNKGTSVDINSSYPYQSAGILPYGGLTPIRPKDSDKYTIMEFYKIEVKSALIKQKARDFLTLRNWKKTGPLSNRYVSNLQNFTCYYSKAEWELLNKSYDFVVKDIEIFYSKGADYYKEFIETLYDLKASSKEQGNLAQSQGYKTLLNSFFGKNCARIDYEDSFFLTKEEYDDYKLNKISDLIIKGKNHKISTFKLNEWEMEQNNDDDIFSEYESTQYKVISTKNLDKREGQVSNILIGAVIAGNGRIQLQQAVMDLGWINFIYCDTDSVYSKVKKDKLATLLDLDKYKLGYWDLESEFTQIRIMGAKRYKYTTIEGTTVNKYCGGNPDPSNKADYDKFYEYGGEIIGGGLRRKEDTHGIFLMPGRLVPKRGLN